MLTDLGLQLAGHRCHPAPASRIPRSSRSRRRRCSSACSASCSIRGRWCGPAKFYIPMPRRRVDLNEFIHAALFVSSCSGEVHRKGIGTLQPWVPRLRGDERSKGLLRRRCN
jgi:hypothetical protein